MNKGLIFRTKKYEFEFLCNLKHSTEFYVLPTILFESIHETIQTLFFHWLCFNFGVVIVRI